MNPLMNDFSSNTDADSPVIVALDFDSADKTLAFVRELDPTSCQIKIGKELFISTGRSLAESLISLGFKLFLDLKYHDIPNTVAQACKVAAQMGVWMVDMHTLGGPRMMEAAKNAVEQCSYQPLLIGVTILTSMDQQELTDVGIDKSIDDEVLQLAKLAQLSGLDGVVCSALEAKLLRQNLGEDFKLVTPGIRLNKNIADDQKRIMTPQEALAAGSTYLVMGRPITQAENPLAVLREVNQLIR